MTNIPIETLMDRMPYAFARRWCFAGEFGGCGCMGCANIGGMLLVNGYTYEDWHKFFPDAPSYEVAHEQARLSYERVKAIVT